MSKHTLTTAFLLAGCVAAGAAPAPAAAQLSTPEVTDPDESFLASTQVTAGYVVNLPDQLLGFSASTVGSKWAGWGLYADHKRSVATPDGEDNFTDERTASDAEALGDQRFGEPQSAWNTFNVALVRALDHEVAIYAGAGYSQETVYQEYFDDQENRGTQGFYIVEDEREGGDVVNLMGGLMFRATRRIMFHTGGQTAPAGFTTGVSLAFSIGR